MTEQTSLTEEERADLVAYLDGELDEEAARAMEAKLTLYPHLRAEAESMRTAWDMLDYLPRPDPSPNFTNRTLEAVSAARLTQHAGSRRWRKVAIGAGWAAGVLLAGLLGFGGMTLVLSQHPTDEDLVRDLPIIEKKRLYEPVDDLEFLQKLAHPDLFGDDHAGS